MALRVKRKTPAMSTVFGTLIAICILVSVIVPTYIYVRNIESEYDKALLDIGEADYERQLENLVIRATTIYDNIVDVRIENLAGIDAHLLRLWVGRSSFIWLNQTLQPMSIFDVGLVDVENGPIALKLVTKRGNIFESQTFNFSDPTEPGVYPMTEANFTNVPPFTTLDFWLSFEYSIPITELPSDVICLAGFGGATTFEFDTPLSSGWFIYTQEAMNAIIEVINYTGTIFSTAP